MKILLTAGIANALGSLLESRDETCAVVLTRRSHADTWVERKLIEVPEDAYSVRNPVRAELKSPFIFEVSEAAKRLNAGILFVHTHPDAPGVPEFSTADAAGERPQRAYLGAKLPGRLHGSLIIGPEGWRAREICGQSLAVKEVGSSIRYRCDPFNDGDQVHQEIYDRQVRAFGAAGQRLISRMKVAFVGAGGTGSVAVQEAAYLGVQDFLLIDNQTLETSNRNRVVGSEPSDIGEPKIDIAERLIKRINPHARVEKIKGDAADPAVLERLIGRDFVFICTDNHLSRLKVTQCCYRHLIPAIDIGVAIAAENGIVESISGRVQMLAPGLPCPLCTNAINSDAIRRETLSEEQKSADPYFEGEGEPQPAVISLNSTMSSLAMTMFCAAVAGLPSKARLLRYDGMSGSVRPVLFPALDPNCPICSSNGNLGAGGHS